MILLDTNVLSELVRVAPDQQVVAWAQEQEIHWLKVASPVRAELMAGLFTLPDGRRREHLVGSLQELLDALGPGIPFDDPAAEVYGLVVAHRQALGRPISTMDAEIAAIARVREASLATRNTKDFAGLGLDLIDPWSA